MKKIMSFIVGCAFLFSANATTNLEPMISESCFEFFHNLYTEFYGGININNVGDFNQAVALCEFMAQK